MRGFIIHACFTLYSDDPLQLTQREYELRKHVVFANSVISQYMHICDNEIQELEEKFRS